MLHATAARADDAEARRAEARAIAEKGDAMFAQGRCDKAIPFWSQANDRFRAPTLRLRVARCQALLGRVVEASATLKSIVDEPLAPSAPQAFVEAQAQAVAELGPVQSRVASLEVDVTHAPGSPEPVVDVDDAPFVEGRRAPIDPGAHRVRVRVRDAEWERRIVLDDGGSERVAVTLTSETPAPHGSVLKPLGYGVGAAGIVALGVGAGFGWWAMRTSSSLSDACGPSRNACPAERQGDIDALKARALTADVALGAGATLLLGGAIMAIAAPTPKREAPRFHIEPFGLGARLAGAF